MPSPRAPTRALYQADQAAAILDATRLEWAPAPCGAPPQPWRHCMPHYGPSEVPSLDFLGFTVRRIPAQANGQIAALLIEHAPDGARAAWRRRAWGCVALHVLKAAIALAAPVALFGFLAICIAMLAAAFFAFVYEPLRSMLACQASPQHVAGLAVGVPAWTLLAGFLPRKIAMAVEELPWRARRPCASHAPGTSGATGSGYRRFSSAPARASAFKFELTAQRWHLCVGRRNACGSTPDRVGCKVRQAARLVQVHLRSL